MNKDKILVIDDEVNILKILDAMLSSQNYHVITARTLAEGRARLKECSPQAIITDLRLGREDGLTLLKYLKEENVPPPIIILTAHGTVDSAVDAMKQGAFDYLLKPFEKSELLGVIRKAVSTYHYQSHHAVRYWRESPQEFPMVGKDDKILKIKALVEKVAPTDSTVLISGESGTGKELIAQAIHEQSPRAKAPFIKINCAAIPDSLMESELFGYERGAFTGAVGSKPGRFELADSGTLFLDEIGEMSVEMQVKLLRVLQDKKFERVGGLRTIQVDVRLVAATNKDLESEVRAEKFRADLYYRLNVVPIVLPPLRDRKEDIPLLIAYFLQKFCEKMKRPIPNLNPECIDLLKQFPWPGNIRQLENLMERTIVMHEGNVTPEELPDEILDFEEQRFLAGGSSLKDQVKEVTRRMERKAIEEALAETSNNVTQSARLLNISRKGLQLKMKELGLR